MEYEASLAIMRELGDRSGESKSRHAIGMIYQLKGDWDRALVEYEASLAIIRELGIVPVNPSRVIRLAVSIRIRGLGSRAGGI
ncbi:MAG: tetratricopeptide repeat protein [bacterium]|nr:tetratricopeptide repeat protein [bacterium]